MMKQQLVLVRVHYSLGVGVCNSNTDGLCCACHVQDYTHYHLDTELTTADINANITTFNLALLGVLANLHGNVSPEYTPFVDVLMQAISR